MTGCGLLQSFTSTGNFFWIQSISTHRTVWNTKLQCAIGSHCYNSYQTQPWNRKLHQIDVVLKHLTSDDCSLLSNSECILHFPDPFPDISLLAGIINFKILTSPFRDRIRFIDTFCCSSSPTEDNSTPWIRICTSGRRVSHRWLSVTETERCGARRALREHDVTTRRAR